MNIKSSRLIIIVLAFCGCISTRGKMMHGTIDVKILLATNSNMAKLYSTHYDKINDSLFVNEIDIAPIKEILAEAKKENRKLIWDRGCLLILSDGTLLRFNGSCSIFMINNSLPYYVITSGSEKVRELLIENNLVPWRKFHQ
jgi:hypothetical protein